jgi:hypothetical protein
MIPGLSILSNYSMVKSFSKSKQKTASDSLLILRSPPNRRILVVEILMLANLLRG